MRRRFFVTSIMTLNMATALAGNPLEVWPGKHQGRTRRRRAFATTERAGNQRREPADAVAALDQLFVVAF